MTILYGKLMSGWKCWIAPVWDDEFIDCISGINECVWLVPGTENLE